ncbi:chorismate-binding protein [Phytohabitans aurantiacus]|uniref:anthranilate synthase n=1 Tax=Phytohabitans aurantiacus TaxID=3016789 RepID=A0ABQ5QXH4_9ACTN|nr:chorismate-binding protein [Phytohabitans aurantiacus]GLH98899.1 phenazine-specific anthranilate synthase component I [Phytohabitans aurantiacus]
MDLITELIAAQVAKSHARPFALLRREGADHIEVYTGDVTTVDRLADIPLPSGSPGPRTLALVPYRQVMERGFACVDDGAPLECLLISSRAEVRLDAALAALPADPVAATGGGFDIGDEEYGGIVDTVLRDEIGRGEGANFVIHRTYTARVADPLRAALSAFRRLLVGEKGAYWTFLVHTGERTMVGATPERHVSVEDGLVMMNPISGTFRHPDGPADRDELLRFLADPKEIDELYMVLDEELKMMATVAEQGGQVVGPYLKEMAHLTHTEYLLAGRGSLDVREVLRETMFAPTVTGSPIENACRVIARHERRGRRYYAAVLALLGHDEAGRQTLDAPILIRTAEFTPDGVVRVPVGATLVRHSTTAGEVAETHAKAAGVLAALGLRPAAPRSQAAGAGLAQDPEVRAALAARNAHLARFWLEERAPSLSSPASVAPRALIVDGEDTFTGMLAHQLRALGLSVTLCPWSLVEPLDDFDLVIAGPGPGDPTLRDDPKMTAMRRVVTDRLDSGKPLLAVCLGHQLLCGLLGLTLHRREATYQGLQREIDLFGARRRVGFYSTFTALALASFVETPYGRVEIARDPLDGAVHGLRGPAFAGLQFHPESVLSQDGVAVLQDLLAHLGSSLTSEVA